MSKERNTLIEATVYKSNKIPNAYILKNHAGKVFFPDKKAMNMWHPDIKEFDNILIWVTQEYSNTGFARVSLDNILLKEYLESLKSLDPIDFIISESTCETIFLNANFYNSDIDFRKYICTTEPRFVEPFYTINKKINEVGINSEEMEFKYNLNILNNYLVLKYLDD